MIVGEQEFGQQIVMIFDNLDIDLIIILLGALFFLMEPFIPELL